jgi:hypothetical protein
MLLAQTAAPTLLPQMAIPLHLSLGWALSPPIVFQASLRDIGNGCSLPHVDNIHTRLTEMAVSKFRESWVNKIISESLTHDRLIPPKS